MGVDNNTKLKSTFTERGSKKRRRSTEGRKEERSTLGKKREKSEEFFQRDLVT